MKKVLKGFLWTLLIIVGVLVIGGIIFISTFDLNKYKPYVENIVYEQTGRKLSLEGDADIKISLVPTIVLHDVSLSNASWAKEENMVRAQQAEVSFSILPLFKKQIVIDTINLVNPEVYLSLNKNGVGNWVFVKPRQEQASVGDKDQTLPETGSGEVQNAQAKVKAKVKDEAEPIAQAAQGAVLAGVVAKAINIENGLLSYTDLKSGSSTILKIKNLSLNSDGMDENINLKFNIVYNGDALVGEAETGSINAILKNTPDFPLKATIKALGVNVTTEMKLNDLMANLRFAGDVTAANPQGNLGLPKVGLKTSVSGTTKEVTLNLTSLDVAGNNITGKIKADLKKSKPYISGYLNSSTLNLPSLTAKTNQTAYSIQIIRSAAAANFVPATNLDLGALNSVNANVDVSIGNLIIDQNVSLQDFKIKVALNGGQLALNPVQASLGGGKINGSVSISSRHTFGANLVGNGIVLQNVLKPLNVKDTQSFGFVSGGKTDFSVNLAGNGSTLRQMVENLNGQIIFVVGDSKIQIGSLKYLSGNFVTQLLSALNIQKQSKNMELTCAVVRSDISNGKAVFPKGIVFNAKQMVLVSDGSINLRNDKLDLTIHPFNGKIADTNVVQAISSLIKIAGTIENPRIALDNSAVIKNVVGVAAAGPAFLGSQLLLDVDDSPCYTALKGTSYQSMFPAPKGMKATGQGIYQGTSNVVNDSVNAITDTAKDVLKLFKGKK